MRDGILYVFRTYRRFMEKLNISNRNRKNKDEDITDVYVDGDLGFSRLVYFQMIL